MTAIGDIKLGHTNKKGVPFQARPHTLVKVKFRSLRQFLERLLNFAEVLGVQIDELMSQLFVAVNEDDIAEFVGEFNLEEFQVGFALPIWQVADSDVLNFLLLGEFDQLVLDSLSLRPDNEPVNLLSFLAKASDEFLQLHRQTGGVLLRIQMHPDLDLRSHPILSDRTSVRAFIWTCDVDWVVSGHKISHFQASVRRLFFLPLLSPDDPRC